MNKNKHNQEKEIKNICQKDFEIPLLLPAVKRIIAMGDIHGDIFLSVASFKIAGLINDKFEWIANPPDTVVVQVGDQIDSCRPTGLHKCHNVVYENDRADDILVLEFFNMMDTIARPHGGAVFSLTGNHELLNCHGRFDYVSYNNYHHFYYVHKGVEYKGAEGRTKAFSPGGPLAKMLAKKRTSIIIIGSNMFVHAGILPNLINNFKNIKDEQCKLKYINYLVRSWLLNQTQKGFMTDPAFYINDPNISPFWTRLYGTLSREATMENNKVCKNILGKTLQVFKVDNLIIGHTPQLFFHQDGINGTCYDKELNHHRLWRIDGGFSHGFQFFFKKKNGKHLVQVLEITNDKQFRVISGIYRDDATILENIKKYLPKIGQLIVPFNFTTKVE
jgi:hypothetical protein